MYRAIFASYLTLFLLTCVNAQKITDEDRRSFDDLKPIKIDVDGDGQLDTITPRIYQISAKPKIKEKPVGKRNLQNWIVFDLITGRGRKIDSFFKYKYGTAEQGGSYWVYALVPGGDLNKDGKTDLIFYAGDDTSHEFVWLANKTSRFVVIKRKTAGSDSW